jgi:hypothetical protein
MPALLCDQLCIKDVISHLEQLDRRLNRQTNSLHAEQAVILNSSENRPQLLSSKARVRIHGLCQSTMPAVHEGCVEQLDGKRKGTQT